MGGGWIAQPLGHMVERAGPGAVWIWGSPWLGVGGDPEGWRWHRFGGARGSWVSEVGVVNSRVPEENPGPKQMETPQRKHRGCVTRAGGPLVVPGP